MEDQASGALAKSGALSASKLDPSVAAKLEKEKREVEAKAKEAMKTKQQPPSGR